MKERDSLLLLLIVVWLLMEVFTQVRCPSGVPFFRRHWRWLVILLLIFVGLLVDHVA